MPILTSTTFISVCGAFGSLLFAKYAIDTTKHDEEEFIGKKIDEMFRFVTSSEMVETPESFIKLLQRISQSQEEMTSDIDRILEEKYRSLSRSLIRHIK